VAETTPTADRPPGPILSLTPPPLPADAPPPGPPPPQAPEPEPGTDRLAIAGLACGILALVPVAVGLGVLAWRRTGRTGARGRGLAAAGVVLSFGWTALAGLVLLALHVVGPERDAAGTVVGAGLAAPSSLRVGDCLETFPAASTADLRVTPCTEAHRAEVVATFDPKESAYPGAAALANKAEKGCTRRLPKALAGSGLPLSLGYLYPQESQWALGDRTIRCVVVSSTSLTAPLPD
jgi:hypothetical protein